MRSGICGIVSRHELSPLQENFVRQMSHEMRFGSDSIVPQFHTSQLILNGHGTLTNERKTISLVADSAIYNKQTIAREMDSGVFKTVHDAEIILRLYEAYGIEGIHQLRGGFAFALYDHAHHVAFFVRDRMGERPLYLWQDDQKLIFASQLKAFARILPLELDVQSLNFYFTLGYVPEPYTPVRGVRKLLNSRILKLDLAKWEFEERVYWDMRNAPPVEGHPTTVLSESLQEASALIAQADHRVGVALSSGIDSSAILALTTRYGVQDAFTISYSVDHRGDEHRNAQRFAESLGVNFHKISIDTENFIEFFPTIVYYADDLIQDITAYCYYILNRTAKEAGVPILLTGHGIDSIFWEGPIQQRIYDLLFRYHNKHDAAFYYKLARHLTQPAPGKARSWRNWLRPLKNYEETLDRLKFMTTPQLENYLMFNIYGLGWRFTAQELSALYQPKLQHQFPERWASHFFKIPLPDENPMVEMIYLHATICLQAGITALINRLSLAADVETRLLFADYRVVEKMIGLYKTQPPLPHDIPKKWLRDAMKSSLPEEILTRPKLGFMPPMQDWLTILKAKYGKDLFDGYLVQKDFLSGSAVKNLVDNTPPGINKSSILLFKLLLAEHWCRRML